MLVELGLVEQRYRAVLEVLNDEASVTDVARRYGVARQTPRGTGSTCPAISRSAHASMAATGAPARSWSHQARTTSMRSKLDRCAVRPVGLTRRDSTVDRSAAVTTAGRVRWRR